MGVGWKTTIAVTVYHLLHGKQKLQVLSEMKKQEKNPMQMQN